MIKFSEKKQNILSQTIQNHNAEVKLIPSEIGFGPCYVLVYLNDVSKAPIVGNPSESLIDLLLRVNWLAKDTEGKYYIPD